jgi:hypothetical protein
MLKLIFTFTAIYATYVLSCRLAFHKLNPTTYGMIPPFNPDLISAYIIKMRIKDFDSNLSRCIDMSCKKKYLSLFTQGWRILNNLNVSDPPATSRKTEELIYQELLKLNNSCKEYTYRQDNSKEISCSDNLYGNWTPYLSKVSRRIGELVKSIDKNYDLHNDFVSKAEARKAEESRRAQLAKNMLEEEVKQQKIEAQQRVKSEKVYQKRYIDFKYESNETDEFYGKVIVDRQSIRKYQSITNNNIAQATFRAFDEYGNILKNDDTGYNLFEIRVNCDIYKSMPDSVGSSGKVFRLDGGIPKSICDEAGYASR